MAQVCAICGKKPVVGRSYKKLISRYNPSPKKKKYPNLQWVKVPKDVQNPAFKKFAGKRIKICTNCLRTLYKTR